MRIAALVCCLIALLGASSVLASTIVVVPLDDRPVTAQLPRMLGAIAGDRVLTPPRALLGSYLQFGDPARLLAWLRDPLTLEADAFVISSDMIAYGGLVGSRTPTPPLFLARSRLNELAEVRAARARASFAVFGTVMRLAPTGLAPIGDAASFFAAGAPTEAIQQYASLPDPPQTAEDRRKAEALRALAGPAVLDAYLATRARNLALDRWLLRQTAEGAYDRVVLGQDDAGPVGLHLNDLAALRGDVARLGIGHLASIEPGADELAMVLVAAQLAREVGVVPTVSVTYSRSDGGAENDPLEFAPFATTIANIVRASGTRAVDGAADLPLFVRVANTSLADEAAFVAAIRAAVADGKPVAVADLTFLQNAEHERRALAETLIDSGLGGTIASFASWNTVANTVGTALPEAIAVLVGKRRGTYDARAHAQFQLDRYVDDYAFHSFARPDLNTSLERAGIPDHTYLLPHVGAATERLNRRLLWPYAVDLLARIYPEYRDAGLTITLPWRRTFETEIDVRLEPRSNGARPEDGAPLTGATRSCGARRIPNSRHVFDERLAHRLNCGERFALRRSYASPPPNG